MEAYDSRHYFEFLAEGIRRHGTRPVTFYKFYDYQKITREKARKYIINRDAISAAESASLGLSGGNHEKANPNKADDIEKE